MSELWAKWEGEVIDGGLPLRRLVGVSDHSAVFLTEAPAYGVANAAIKLVPAIPTLAESQLAHWNTAASLSHPRLLRLYATGRCQLPGGPMGQGNQHFLYVLMEYADQTLAQLLETRALTEVETKETLPPTLEALGFLHSKNMVQGQLKPSNILVVGEQLKLASDTIRPAGEAATSISMLSVYDPPEGRDGSFSTAGDIWALGVTLYEALTRTTPTRPDERSHGVILPPDFPSASADVIRECLSRRPTDRPSVAVLQAWINGKVRYPGTPAGVNTGTDQPPGTRAADVHRGHAVAASGDSNPSRRFGAGAGGSDLGGGIGTGAGDSDLGGGIGAGAGGSDLGGGIGAGAGDSDRGGRRGGGLAEAAVANDDGRARGVAATAGAGVLEARGASGANTGTAEMDRAALSPGRSLASDTAAPTVATARDTAGSSQVPGRLTIRAVVEREPIEEEAPPSRSYLPWAAAAVAAIAVGWGAVHLLRGHSSANPPAANTSTHAPRAAPQSSDAATKSAPSSQESQSPAASTQQAAPSKSEERSRRHAPTASNSTPNGSSPTATTSAAVVHEEIPNVPHSALATIHGHVKVAVRVTVDSTGNVIDDTLDHAGPSHYFARVASQAARKWKFAATDQKSHRQWVVHFDFSRGGTTAHATGPRS